MKILVLDNYDSFTYNLVHLLEKLVPGGVEVCLNDQIDLDQVPRFNKILLSPGPGLPEEAGRMKSLIRQYGSTIPILGVCLGHQAIGEVYGASLLNLPAVYHGVSTTLQLSEPRDVLFQGLSERPVVGRYHSWVVDREGLPDALRVTACDENGRIMAFTHVSHPVKGVQFHPESIMTPEGENIIRNWLFS